MAISMLKIRRPLGRLIFNMGIAIPGKTVFLIETAPSLQPVKDRYCSRDPIALLGTAYSKSLTAHDNKNKTTFSFTQRRSSSASDNA